MLILSRRKQAHAGPGAAGSGELQIVLQYQASPVGGQGGWTEQPAGGIVVRLFKMSQQPVAKHPVPSTTTDEEVRALLVRYRRLVPFHVVRTRFLGNIASPGMGVSPIKMVERLWGGEFPEFETIGAANELIGALVMGLWNRLSRHQDRNSPFRLTRIETKATREGLAALAMLRRRELDGFVEGLFGVEEALDFPERAHRGLGALSEMWALFEGTEAVARDETKPGTVRDMETTLRLLRQMTRDAEHEIHAILLSCARARRQMLASLPAQKPTLH
jgi:hypothetical protein